MLCGDNKKISRCIIKDNFTVNFFEMDKCIGRDNNKIFQHREIQTSKNLIEFLDEGVHELQIIIKDLSYRDG